MENRFSFPLAALLVFFFAITVALSEIISLHPPKDRFLIPPPEDIERFGFGFSESMADSFWLRWIQDADNCQTYTHPVESVASKPLFETADTRFADTRHKICDGSWSFKMLDAVTRLAPKFSMPYLAGGISLAVLTEDYSGATVIFDRGVANFPDDWNMQYRAAYHFMIDLHESAKAAELLSRAADHGAPSWTKALASRLFTESGQLELALRTLLAYRATMKGDTGVKDVEDRIDTIRRKIAVSSDKTQ